MAGYRDVHEGDCLNRIAYLEGFAPDTLLKLSENEGLQRRRDSHNVLDPDEDKVFVPDKRIGEVSKAVDQRHRFKRRAVPSILKVRLTRQDGRPREDVPWLLDIAGVVKSGVTGADGLIVQTIPPDASEGKLTVGRQPQLRTFTVRISHLTPAEDSRGALARLRQLGFLDAHEDPDEYQLRRAVEFFQRRWGKGLTATGDLDQATRDALELAHEG